MWVARVLKCPVDKSNAPSLSRAEFKKLDSGINRSFVTLAHHLRLVATNERSNLIGLKLREFVTNKVPVIETTTQFPCPFQPTMNRIPRDSFHS
jgi:hypothetical protein